MSEEEQKAEVGAGRILSDLLLSDDQAGPSKADLIVEPESAPERDSFAEKLEETLRETERAVLSLEAAQLGPEQSRSWDNARQVVEQFKPVPWFIWRLSNYVLGKPGQIAEATEGLVFGLRRLLLAAGSDELLGEGRKVSSTREALQVLGSDIIAAAAVIHAVCRRLSSRPFERIWRPILDDALLRARIGFYAGRHCAEFGSGRGMLAGFAGRSGLCVLISSGNLEQARQALEMLATGTLIRNVGLAIYSCDPLQVSAMALSAGGCGREAAFGTVGYASDDPFSILVNEEQLRWYSAFAICEAVRTGNIDGVDQRCWESLGLSNRDDRSFLLEEAKRLVRRGHGWNWLG